ncbi:UBC-like protein [Lindgomyces ingoldianus]|uniref:UBC-like protein n=1 Tax=Lindgomyces ingoldianus TaxID=673940 RepID=A0ACB6QY70_9PLEO|nr:UBC-like protein [Lindgomyces ingoldianus]KAF2471943.1 UBC-like protein [Lindgomyces ingoldianus]
MNSKSLRRLAADHGSLHRDGLPPNYLFPPSGTTDPSSDLTTLDVLLAGPPGTPYSEGVWRLHLDIPPAYPTAPPTATFRTRLWHPNIDESTGAVCVETLKRDWVSTLKLRDVLMTISCLLIQPNPASALNEAAGKLASEDWESFCRRAKLMTGIHAAVPSHLVDEVKEAQVRGEEKGETNDKDNESMKAIPAPSKIHASLSAEDEENTRRRGESIDPESDPDSDWIPGPIKSSKTFPTGRNNIFGIKGLDDGMRFDTPPEKATITAPRINAQEEDEDDDCSDSFIIVPSKPLSHKTFKLKAPYASCSKTAKDASTATPDLLKFSHKNPFSAIRLDDQTHPLFKELSWSWQDSEILHDTGTIKDALTKAETRKRMAGAEFEERRIWEMKKFKKTGCDLSKYNRGDFGPRTGVARL